MAQRGAVLKQLATGLVVCILAVGLTLFLVPAARETVVAWFGGKDQGDPPRSAWEQAVKLIGDSTDRNGLRISDEAMANLEVHPVEVKLAVEPRPLPPQVGTVNYDNDHLFTIRPRFPGEMVEFMQVKLDQNPYGRDLRFGDTVKQGDVLGVLWSKDLGMAKADLVDAIIAKKLSAEKLQRHLKGFEDGITSLATLRESETKAIADRNAYARALRPLMMWKLPKEDIAAVEKEAETIAKEVEAIGDPIKARNIDEEVKRWSRVEIKAPVFAQDRGEADSKRTLVVLEKNTS